MPPTTEKKSTDDSTEEIETAELVRGWEALEGRRPQKLAEIFWAARTDIGRARENNEDKFDFFLPDEPAQLAARGRLWAVADGMGGHNAGQVASEAALKTLIRCYFAAPQAGQDSVTDALQAALTEANDLIYRAAHQFEGKSGMGTTVVAVVVCNDTLTVAHIGDSRGYLLRDGSLRPLTTDHSWVEEQVRRGNMSRAEAEASPYRNYILRSVGVEPSVKADISTETLQVGDIVLLCTDGLTGHVSDEQLARLLSGKSMSQAVLDLIDAANDAGGKDNVTALAMQVKAIGGYGEGDS